MKRLSEHHTECVLSNLVTAMPRGIRSGICPSILKCCYFEQAPTSPPAPDLREAQHHPGRGTVRPLQLRAVPPRITHRPGHGGCKAYALDINYGMRPSAIHRPGC